MALKKRSVSIQGHSTSFSLEDEFWRELKQFAKQRKISIAQLVTQVDSKRAEGENLSSALRLYVFRLIKSAAEQQNQP